jgi:hypothetical protein
MNKAIIPRKDLGRVSRWEIHPLIEKCINPKYKSINGKMLQVSWGSQEPVAHACNVSYLGGRHWKDHGSRPAQANSSEDPISKIAREK